MGFRPLKPALPDTPRSTARAAMAAQWVSLPAWIRGPFGATYAAAIALLDAGDDEAAAALIQYAQPPAAYDEGQVAVFVETKSRLLFAITELPGAG